MSRHGAVRFAQYAYPPNELGYCGPPGAAAMLDPGAADEIDRRARLFDGAWSYLELLAEAAGIADPLDVRGGGRLLGRQRPAGPGRPARRWWPGWRTGSGARSAAPGARPRTRASAHHSFQVFEVYPWAGLLREGRPPGPAVRRAGPLPGPGRRGGRGRRRAGERPTAAAGLGRPAAAGRDEPVTETGPMVGRTAAH